MSLSAASHQLVTAEESVWIHYSDGHRVFGKKLTAKLINDVLGQLYYGRFVQDATNNGYTAADPWIDQNGMLTAEVTRPTHGSIPTLFQSSVERTMQRTPLPAT